MYEVKTREIPERSLLCVKRNVTGEKAAWAFGKEFIALLRHYKFPQIEGRASTYFQIFWGEVSEDSDGPIEWCRPRPSRPGGSARRALLELTLRTEPAHGEAFVPIGDGQLDGADWQVGSRSLETWSDQQQRNVDIRLASLGLRITYLPSEVGQDTYRTSRSRLPVRYADDGGRRCSSSRADEVLRLVELIDDLEVRRPTLEDVQLKLTANNQQGSLT